MNCSIGRNYHYLPGDSFAAGFQGTPDCVFDAAATRHNHAYHRYASEVVVGKDVGELFGIVTLVQFRTANQSNPVADKFRMKIAIGISGTVGCYKKVGSFVAGCGTGTATVAFFFIFAIPYNRQELADYLEVDRSGLSTEIGKLCREGVLECKRNHFHIV